MAENPETPSPKELKVHWPLSIGEKIELAHTSAVTTVQGGHVLELGRFILSGHVRRSSEEVEEFLRQQEVQVVGRFFLPDGSLQQLLDLIEKRLEAEQQMLEQYGEKASIVMGRGEDDEPDGEDPNGGTD